MNIREKGGSAIGKKDVVTKEFLKDSTVFADVFNYYVYQGKQVIRPETLHSLDTQMLANLYGGKKASFSLQRFRDILKYLSGMENEEAVYLILAIEAQSEVHYAMTIRNMLYDALQYQSQAEEIARKHRRQREKGVEKVIGHGNTTEKQSSGEFLSGFYKDDKVLPVITLVIYFNDNEWDGPISLHELLDITDEHLYRYIPDYKINLISPYSITEEEAQRFHSDMREVMLYLKYAGDQKKLKELVERDEKFRHLDRRTMDTINIVTNSKLNYDEGKEVVDVCQAIRDMIEESKAEGRAEGRIVQYIETSKEYGVEESEIIEGLMQKFNMSLEEAKERLVS